MLYETYVAIPIRIGFSDARSTLPLKEMATRAQKAQRTWANPGLAVLAAGNDQVERDVLIRGYENTNEETARRWRRGQRLSPSPIYATEASRPQFQAR